MERAVAQGRVASVKIETGVEVVDDLQAGFFEAVKGAAVGEQFSFKRAPAGLGLGVSIGVTRPATAGQLTAASSHSGVGLPASAPVVLTYSTRQSTCTGSVTATYAMS